jgi:hypothetical protein
MRPAFSSSMMSGMGVNGIRMSLWDYIRDRQSERNWPAPRAPNLPRLKN